MSFNMWELSKRQAKEFEIIYLMQFFESFGYKLKKTQTSEYDFNKKYKEGRDIVCIGHLESFPGSKIEFIVMKEINEIENHLSLILKGLNENRNNKVYNSSVKFSMSYLKGVFTNNFMPEMLNEADVAASCEIVKKFMIDTGFPMLERFNDIKKLDNEINCENFWTTDWQMPFNLGGDFDIKRMIIAKLSNNPNLNNIINYHLKNFDDLIATGEYVDLRKESKRQFEYAVEYLRNL